MASTEIEDFNWNLRHFLDVMEIYQTNVNKANRATFQLLEKALDKLGNLIENVDEVDQEPNETIILSIDESKFQVKRSIFCRICNVDFGATRTKYILHSADSEHNRKLIDYMNKMDTNNNNGEIDTTKVDRLKMLPKLLDESNASMNKDRLDTHTNETAIAVEKKQQHIPNVFDNDIFDFLDSIGKSNNGAALLLNVKDQLDNESQKAKPFGTGAIPKTSWRVRSNENTRPAQVEQWRQNTNANKQNHSSTPDQLMRSKSAFQTQATLTQSVIQNGATLSGAGMRPCALFELNNMYTKYPHLNKEKVPNPLKPTQAQKTTQNDTNGKRVKNSNEKTAKTSNSARNLKQMSELTYSLSSLPALKNKSLSASRGRSSSSNNLVGSEKSTDSGQQKGIHKSPMDDKKKGAIPKQSNRTGTQLMNSNETTIVSDEAMTHSVDAEKLKNYFSRDLSSFINLMVTVASRPEQIVNQKKLIQSVENLLKPKFPTAKAFLIGSHAYKIMKGGLATMDIYLDLHNSFNTDKAGYVFIEGMNETLKLMRDSEEWSNVECSEQSRYAILSAEHVIPGSENRKCHFTFGTGVAVKNTEIIQSLFAAQPVAQQVVICIRLALKDGSTGQWASHFSGYVVTLLVIFYLQIEKKLPSVSSLQLGVTTVKCGENLVQFKNPSVAICKDRIRDLLIGFFSYYQNFDFSNKIISPFEGCEIHKNFRDKNPSSLSHSMYRFKNLIDSEPKRWTRNHMCVQDTFEHKRNVTHQINENHVKAFKDFCANSLAVIQEIGPSVKY